MSELHTVDVEKRLREKRDDFVLKQHFSAKSDVWKHFSLVLEKRREDNKTIIDKSDRKLFRQATNPGHSLRHLLPQKPQPTDLTSYVRGNIHICFPLFNIPSLKLLHQSVFI